MNQTIPEMTLNAALRSFGNWRITTSEQTILHFGPQKWNREDFQADVDGVPYDALRQTRQCSQEVSGETRHFSIAVIRRRLWIDETSRIK